MTALSWCSLRLDPNGSNVTKTVAFGSIYQGVACHDIAVLTVRGEDPSMPEFSTGTPCHITYGWNPNQLEDFFGYVNHVTPPYERSQFNQMNYYMDVVCVGASFVYKNALTQIWLDTQISSVVAQLATTGMFSAITQTDDRSWSQISSAGESQWSFLVECATKLGWILACNQTNFRFMSVDRLLSMNQAAMPTFRTKEARSGTAPETINNFHSLQGETIGLEGHVRANRISSNVDMRTGKIYTVQNNASTVDATALGPTKVAPFFVQYEKDLVAADQVIAQYRMDAEAQRNRFHIQAEASVTGDTSVVQGIPIALLGLGPLNSGVWFVEEVCHTFSFGIYTMYLTLGRDSSGDGKQRALRSPMIAWSQGDPFSMYTAHTPPTILVNNQWRASWQATQVVGL